MIIYEVNADVEPAIADQYRAWLQQHIPEVLACAGFLEAEMFEREGATDGKLLLTVQYKVRDRQALDVYLKEHAPSLRQDGIDRFGTRFSASRRILEHKQHFARSV